ncbi:MAG: helix-turn-helix domain-containing protein [Candidatus Neomarinimicrobiota bacterium]
MFSLFDVLTIIFVILFLTFFFFLFQIERFRTKPRLYLKLGLLAIMFVLIADDLLINGIPFAVRFLLPLMFWANLMIYPLIYAYSRDLVFNGRDNNRPPLFVYTILPTIIFIVLAFVYYPLGYAEKLQIATFHFSERNTGLHGFALCQWVIIPAYYLQTVVYIFLTLKLIQIARKNLGSNFTETLLVRYISFYIVAVIFYEGAAAILGLFTNWTGDQKNFVDILLTTPFIIFAVYIGFKQNLIVLQSRFNRISHKLDSNLRGVITIDEKNGIKAVIDEYLSINQLYLNPDLHIGLFAKKVHVPARKISQVINEVYDQNFVSLINKYRIAAATRLIEEKAGDVKINELYLRVGFNSRSAFNRVFKTVNGSSPSEYIRSLR